MCSKYTGHCHSSRESWLVGRTKGNKKGGDGMGGGEKEGRSALAAPTQAKAKMKATRTSKP